MDAQATTDALLLHFRSLADPRAANARHLLADLLSIAICAVFCGAEGWTDVELWGHFNHAWLSTFLDLPHGIPGHNTFERVFARLNPDQFEQSFVNFTAALAQTSSGKLIAVDGKTLRGSFDHAWSRSPVHMVSAYAAENHLILGQKAARGKGQELKTIGELLALLELKDTTVTIDALGCQKEIAAQIRQQKGHYVLALKDNQPTLAAKVKTFLDEAILQDFADLPHGYVQSTEGDHGRIETRRCWVCNQVQHLAGLEEWMDLAAVAVVECTREVVGGKTSVDRRYFITSHPGNDAGLMARAVRHHWGIESMHWVLDVAMLEDKCRLRKDYGAENFSRLRRMAINKLKRETTYKVGIRSKQKACGWSYDFLLKALLA
jgi:predicted transposase YbfD/YdcC